MGDAILFPFIQYYNQDTYCTPPNSSLEWVLLFCIYEKYLGWHNIFAIKASAFFSQDGEEFRYC